MGSRLALPLAAAALAGGLATGCGEELPRMPFSCTQQQPELYTPALRAAPGDVRLGDGTAISTCVTRARSDADLQALGLLLSGVAEDLAIRARDARDPVAATRLGFLAGAVRRGASRTNGIQENLARRIEGTAIKLEGAPARVQTALVDGTRAGLARG
ncbi:hypothetical protein [Conexibacter sp. SYSU D00693]|uniref:hypothetical protein n=1 Tax=Conexibacter sp. SYSU D00693 TaxID=2812560 RepID=UPI00196AA7DE|nr:hypothetical protein [Conexibacter sp. SYSU D00693]